MPTHTSLKYSPRCGDSLLSDQLEANLLGYFSWAFLGAGAFTNVYLASSGCYGGDPSRLRKSSDPNYEDGQVWEGFRKDWVWETGVEYPTQPIRVSGVYVDGTFHSVAATGTYAHYVDYPNGRVVFASPISPTGSVNCEHSYKNYQFLTADHPWWQEVQPGSFRIDDSHFLQNGSGNWDILPQSRVQAPAVIVESVLKTDRKGKQLGGGEIVKQDVLFHVISEDRWHLKWAHDALTYQWEKRILGFDKNRMMDADAYPLDVYGSPRPSGLMYPDLIKGSGDGGFYWNQIRLLGGRSQDQIRIAGLHYCTVRMTAEVDLVA